MKDVVVYVLLITAIQIAPLTPQTMIRCRNYRYGAQVVNYVSCNGECAVTIFKRDDDKYWFYHTLGCEQNCFPTNDSFLEVMYIKTCCFNDLCSLNILHALHPTFPNDVILKRINNDDAYNETSTITSTTMYTVATISTVIATSPVETAVMLPSSPDKNNQPPILKFSAILVAQLILLGFIWIINITVLCFVRKRKRQAKIIEDQENQTISQQYNSKLHTSKAKDLHNLFWSVELPPNNVRTTNMDTFGIEETENSVTTSLRHFLLT